MIKTNKDGVKYYYYYKKKVGRPKKRGPKPSSDKVKLLKVADKKSFYLKRPFCFYNKYTKIYRNKYEFKEHEPLIYECCSELGYIDAMYPYTCNYKKNECIRLCKEYKYSDELKVSNIGLYECIEKHGWLDSIYPYYKDKYSKTNCSRIASSYKTYKEFRDSEPSVYYHCLHNEYLKEFTWLIDDRIQIFTGQVDCVYSYEFKDSNSIYIGRTLMSRIKSRDWEHIYNKDIVKWFGTSESLPEMKILETGLTIQQGLEREDYYVKHYKSLGYNVLNKANTGVGSGSVGSLGCGKWNRERCYEVALKCKTISEFDDNYGGAYRVAKQNGWLEDYTWFKEKPKRNYWNYENCRKASKECATRTIFQKKYPAAWLASRKNNWLDDFYSVKYYSSKKYIKGNKNMDKSKKYYKIDVSTMLIVNEYKKINEVTKDREIYRVINGEKKVFKDGYMYRKVSDVLINKEDGTVTDLLSAKSKMDKKYDKYEYTINLLNNSDLSISEICVMSRKQGIKICEATCRRLQKEYALD